MDADSCDSGTDDDAGASGGEFTAYPQNPLPKSVGPGREAFTGNDEAPLSSDEDSESEDLDEEKPPEGGSQGRGPVPLAADVLAEGSVVVVATVDLELYNSDSIHGGAASIGGVIGALKYQGGKLSPLDLSETQPTLKKLYNIRRPLGTQAMAACTKIHGISEKDPQAAETFDAIMPKFFGDVALGVEMLSERYNVTAVVFVAHNGRSCMHAM